MGSPLPGVTPSLRASAPRVGFWATPGEPDTCPPSRRGHTCVAGGPRSAEHVPGPGGAGEDAPSPSSAAVAAGAGPAWLLRSAPPAPAARASAPLRPRLRRLPALPPVGRGGHGSGRSAAQTWARPVCGQRRRGPRRCSGRRGCPGPPPARWPAPRLPEALARRVPSPRAGGRGARPGRALGSVTPSLRGGELPPTAGRLHRLPNCDICKLTYPCHHFKNCLS